MANRSAKKPRVVKGTLLRAEEPALTPFEVADLRRDALDKAITTHNGYASKPFARPETILETAKDYADFILGKTKAPGGND